MHTFNYVAVVSFEENYYSVGEASQHLKVDLILNVSWSTNITIQILFDIMDTILGKLTVVCTYLNSIRTLYTC